MVVVVMVVVACVQERGGGAGVEGLLQLHCSGQPASLLLPACYNRAMCSGGCMIGCWVLLFPGHTMALPIHHELASWRCS